MPGMALHNGLGLCRRCTPFHQFQNVEASARTHNVGHLTDRQLLGCGHKGRRIPVRSAQTQLTAVAAVTRRKLLHQTSEIFTGAKTAQSLLRLCHFFLQPVLQWRSQKPTPTNWPN
jgi:hypothetical protein